MNKRTVKEDCNKSFLFILPFLGLTIRNSPDPILNYCSGVYIGDASDSELQNKILILFEDIRDPLSDDIENTFTKNEWYRGQYVPKEGYVMYIFEVPDSYKKDYEYFIEGKYSLFNDSLKKLIVKYHCKKLDVHSPIYGVLYKTEQRREYLEKLLSYDSQGNFVSSVTISPSAEYASIINLDEEVFDKNQLKDISSVGEL